MSSLEDYDGLCGIPHFQLSKSDKQAKCTYKIGHDGPHSWQKNICGGPVICFTHTTTLDRSIK